MSAAYVGEGKTDAKDAHVIAETARIRRDLSVVGPDSDLVRELAVLVGHRADLIADRVRMINRLRDLMTSVFPTLEREFDYKSCKGAVVLLTGYASPDQIRRVGQARLATWLQRRRVRHYADLAARAITAARAQTITLPGQDLAAHHHQRVGRQHPRPRRARQSTRHPDRSDLRTAPAGRDHRIDARLRPHPWCLTAARSWRPRSVSHPGSPRRGGRPGSRAKRPRTRSGLRVRAFSGGRCNATTARRIAYLER